MSHFNTHTTTDKTVVKPAGALPMGALFLLAMTSFIATANEIVPAGLLPQIAQSFVISQSWAGQLVSACALGSGVAAIPLTLAFRGWRRKKILMLTLLIFFIGNTVTALSPYYSLTLAARFLVGLATGLAWSQLASYARQMVPVSMQGRALTVAMAGIPTALCLGVPLSAWAGKLLGWPLIFAILAGLTLTIMVSAALIMPDFPAPKKESTHTLVKVLRMPGVGRILAVVITWILAHYLLYTYIAPYLSAIGLSAYLDEILLLFGMSAIAGLWGVGWLIDRGLRGLILTSLALFAVTIVALVFCGSASDIVLVCLAVSLWGFSFSGAPTLLQTALAEIAGDAADVAQSMLVTVFNLAFALSGILGGVILALSGTTALLWVILMIILLAWVIAWQMKFKCVVEP